MAKRRANGEGSLYKRKDGTWTAQYTDYTGKKRYLYGKTQQIVKDKLKEALRNSENGIVLDTRKITFSKWVTEWLVTYIKPVVRESTYGEYDRVARLHVIPYFERVPLKDVRAEMLQKFLNEKLEKRLDGRPGGYSYSVVHAIKHLIGAALEKAVDLGYLAFNPANKVKIPPERYGEKHVLTKSQQAALEKLLLDNLDTEPNDFIYLLILYTGLRIGEATGLQVGDIDLSKRELYVRRTLGRVCKPGGGSMPVAVRDPKTNTGRRTVSLSPFIVDLLQKHIERRNKRIEQLRPTWEGKNYFSPEWIDNDFLFISSYGIVPDHSKLLQRLNKLLQKIGAAHVTLHGLRHTFATRWIEAGLDVRSLSEILGHADAKMTLNTYTHSLPEQKRQSMDRLTLLLGAEKPGNTD